MTQSMMMKMMEMRRVETRIVVVMLAVSVVVCVGDFDEDADD